jgi:hypothetical protein
MNATFMFILSGSFLRKLRFLHFSPKSYEVAPVVQGSTNRSRAVRRRLAAPWIPDSQRTQYSAVMRSQYALVDKPDVVVVSAEGLPVVLVNSFTEDTTAYALTGGINGLSVARSNRVVIAVLPDDGHTRYVTTPSGREIVLSEAGMRGARREELEVRGSRVSTLPGITLPGTKTASPSTHIAFDLDEPQMKIHFESGRLEPPDADSFLAIEVPEGANVAFIGDAPKRLSVPGSFVGSHQHFPGSYSLDGVVRIQDTGTSIPHAMQMG